MTPAEPPKLGMTPVELSLAPMAQRTVPGLGRTRNAGSHLPEPGQKSRLLLEFRHGLGDAVQLTIVLRHLRRERPLWEIDVASTLGKQSLFRGLCRRSLLLDRDVADRSDYDAVLSLDWDDCAADEGLVPTTKPTRCLSDVFQIAPDPDLYRYHLTIGTNARDRARHWLASICPSGTRPDGRYPSVVIHYLGHTSKERKDLSHELIQEICDIVREQQHVPVILDWTGESPLPDQASVHCPGADHALWGGLRTGDAETLGALIEHSALMVGIDSGPLHIAGATSTPTIGVWTGHHPSRYFDRADHVLHLVPEGHSNGTLGPNALDHFERSIPHRVYGQLNFDLPAQVESHLTGDSFEQVSRRRLLGRLTSTAYDRRYYDEHRRAGLDYLGFGDWQRSYGRWLVESLGWRAKQVLDVGCACGSILRGLRDAGSIAWGIDLSEHMIGLGRQACPELAAFLHTCDAANLHLFSEGRFDALHSAQVAEHWKPKHVPLILEELRRVTKPGGFLFCSLDTEELFTRQGREMAFEDPTHVCIRPLSWWHEQLQAAGWTLCDQRVRRRLTSHPGNFLARYDWDWFLARNPRS